ncbi:MAG: phosphotransferase [Myxococcales bacterium]|nr:phosphotransferase [Myxococcales bacterium]
MNAPWVPQRVVDAAQAQALMQEAWPSLQIDSIVAFGAGWDNTAFLVNQAWVVRFPRRENCVVSMRREIAALPLLAAKLPLKIPVPTFVCDGTPSFDWPFAAYPVVPGATACKLALSDDERLAAAPRVADFLRALHAIDRTELAAAALPEVRFDFAVLATWEERTASRLDTLVAAGLVPPSRRAALMSVIERGGGGLPSTAVVLHGDLYVRHIVMDAGRTVAGIIDWGDVEFGDVARDLAVAFTMFPPRAREHFLGGYGATTADADFAQVIGTHHAVSALAYAHAQDDADLRREMLLATAWLTMG